MMNATTGQWLSLTDHVRQSIFKILWTLRGTRIMRRSLFSLLPELIDAPTDEIHLAKVRASAVLAIVRHEPRFSVKSVVFRVTEGAVLMVMSGWINGTLHTIDYPFVQNGVGR
ncbi:MAG: GPW/gp25 family protein [Burkholderiales bacterium]|nr:GPW/gp25 family protein [Burkholderiales bacterium]